KTGPKFKDAAQPSSAGAADDKATIAALRKATVDKEGFPVPPPPGSWIITRSGHTRMHLPKIDTATFARQLRNQLGQPVIDATGLTGTYDFTVTFSADPSIAMDDDDAPDIFTAVEQQLGLMLESAKVPTEVIVVDHAEKIPIDN